MSLVIHTNVQSLQAVNQMNNTHSKQMNSMSALGSGLRVNQSGDDAAGLSISTGITSMIMGNAQAKMNTAHGLSVAQTMDGSVQEVNDIYQRMRELGIQSLNGTYSDANRQQMDYEFQALYEEIGRIGNSLDFNGQKLLNTDSNISIQVGAEAGNDNRINVKTINLGNLDALAVDPNPTTNFDTVQIAPPTGFDGLVNALGIPVGDSIDVSLGGETLNISYDTTNGLLAGNNATANSGAGFNSTIASWVNSNPNLSTAGYSATYDSTNGSIVIKNSTNNLGAGALTYTPVASYALGAGFSGDSGTVIPAGTPPPEPPPPGAAMNIRTVASATTSVETIDRRLGVLSDFLADNGATQNRLSAVDRTLSGRIENDSGVR